MTIPEPTRSVEESETDTRGEKGKSISTSLRQLEGRKRRWKRRRRERV